jgi:Ni/Fe-hydrogenase subunit HybB-like protein
VMALLFLPIVPGMHAIYHWTHADALSDPVIAAKAAYLNTPFFLARAAFYFAVWIGISQLLLKWSKEQDATGDPAYASKLSYLSAPGLLVYTLTVTFAITDWLMSVNPHWFSTMWGPLFMVGQALGAMALAINVLVLLSTTAPMNRALNPSHFHDLGKLLFAFLMMWAYLTFSQFLIVYSANLQEEVPHYLTRIQNGYQYVTIALVLLHFVVPYVILLSRDVKRDTTRLRIVAAWLIVMRFVDHYWQVAPEFHDTLSVSVIDVALPIAIGGIFLTLYAMRLKSQPLMPLHDAGLEKALTHHVH